MQIEVGDEVLCRQYDTKGFQFYGNEFWATVLSKSERSFFVKNARGRSLYLEPNEILGKVVRKEE